MPLAASFITPWFLWAAYWLMPVTDRESIAMSRRGDDSMNRRRGWVFDGSADVWDKQHQADTPTQSFCPSGLRFPNSWPKKEILLTFLSFTPHAGTCLTLSQKGPNPLSCTVLYFHFSFTCLRAYFLGNKFVQARAAVWVLAASGFRAAEV